MWAFSCEQTSWTDGGQGEEINEVFGGWQVKAQTEKPAITNATSKLKLHLFIFLIKQSVKCLCVK